MLEIYFYVKIVEVKKVSFEDQKDKTADTRKGCGKINRNNWSKEEQRTINRICGKGWFCRKCNAQPKLNIKIPDFQIDIHQGKCVGNVLDLIIDEMEEQEYKVPVELIELKQWLRFKGNSKRENGDESLWDIGNTQHASGENSVVEKQGKDITRRGFESSRDEMSQPALCNVMGCCHKKECINNYDNCAKICELLKEVKQESPKFSCVNCKQDKGHEGECYYVKD